MAVAATRPAAAIVLPSDVRLARVTAMFAAALGLLLIAAMAVAWLSRQPFFAIRGITVAGDVTHNSVATIRANAAPRLTGNFLTMDLAAVRQAFESVPWVRTAVVRRVWPNRLSVELQEHRPVALWAAEIGNEKLVNNYGEVFEANLGDVEDDALPTLAGPAGSAAHVLTMFGRIVAAFAPLDANVDGLALSSRGSWRATLDDGVKVELGRGSDDEVVARTARFVATVPEMTGRFQRPLAHADLRHTQGYAVRLKGVSTTAVAGDRPAPKTPKKQEARRP